MYLAKDNKGLYKELKLVVDYIEDYNELTLIDKLIKEFKNAGIDFNQLKLVKELINKYLPTYIECCNKGCYLIQEINNLKTITYFNDLDNTSNHIVRAEKQFIIK